MTACKLIARSLRYYWRSQLGVLAGVAVATAVLVGAFVVGDSVRGSLKAMALTRLGDTQVALESGDRLFRADLAKDLESVLKCPVEPVLALGGSARLESGRGRANRVEVLGVDRGFWEMAASEAGFDTGSGTQVIVNERLAAELGAAGGDYVQIRVQRPALLSADAPLSSAEGGSIGLTARVTGIASDAQLGRFSLRANLLPPANAFVPASELDGAVGRPGRANVLLAGGGGAVDGAKADAALRRVWRLADAELEVRAIPRRGQVELRSGRVFLDRPVVAACPAEGIGVLTYFVNGIRRGERSTPYSMVSAIGGLDGGPVDPLPTDMKDDEIVLNDWLAEDLQAAAGDEVELTYYVFGPMRTLKEETARFRVRAVTAMAGAADDPELMPQFPGLTDADNCRDWDADFPLDLDRVRDKDEHYWDSHRGTPKAFVTLAAGRRLWANRFGDLTAIRYEAGRWPLDQLELSIRQRLSPADVGLFFRPVRAEALAAGAQSEDFGQLFASLSFFLIVSAVLLMALLFAFGIQHRSGQIGTLLALGLPRRRVRMLLLAEGAVLAAGGAAIGAAGGLAYTRAILVALTTVWSGAVAGASGLQLFARPATVAASSFGGAVIAVAAMWLALRRQLSRPICELLAPAGALGLAGVRSGRGRRRWPAWIAVVCAAAAVSVVVVARVGEAVSATVAFFSAGGLLLVAGLAGCVAILGVLGRSGGAARLTLAKMSARGLARRPSRSLATVALLACGAFMIVAVGANRQGAAQDVHLRSSGSGGFALLAESALPVYQDLNTEAGLEAMGLEPKGLGGVRFAPLRVREGDDASCLNLNRAQRPRLLGVRPEDLASRGAFRFVEAGEAVAGESPWQLLDADVGQDVVAGIADEPTLTWGLKKKVGESIDYVDDRGRPFRVRFVAAIAGSILQGSVLIAEGRVVERFPSAGGYRSFLIDAPPGRSGEVAAALEEKMSDYGFDATPTARRLADLSEVQNTYLSIFEILGGLGLLVGSAGLAVVVGRNVLERRGELALLRAVGLSRKAVRRAVLWEHWLLLAMGLVCGVAAAVVAVLPALRSAGGQTPVLSLVVLLAAVGISGVLWTTFATMWATRGPLLAALRSE